eukprot:TRINITY_DN28387_c0_g2_i1.p1 TRINITY_DN28387_c0_g2~~TRINITY_DN28387_c0_g2_i1.p1  ORF type:complete len:127 (-),score=7.85 TRINITY_DN28387_c0_g2_i1:60-440(-)
MKPRTAEAPTDATAQASAKVPEPAATMDGAKVSLSVWQILLVLLMKPRTAEAPTGATATLNARGTEDAATMVGAMEPLDVETHPWSDFIHLSKPSYMEPSMKNLNMVVRTWQSLYSISILIAQKIV